MMPLGRHYLIQANPQLQLPIRQERELEESEPSTDNVQAGENADTYEPDDNLIHERLLALYPALESDTSELTLILPSAWNTSDKSRNLMIGPDGLRVTHRNLESGNKSGQNNTASAVRANNPIQMICGIYYFEILLKESASGCLGIGVCHRSVAPNRLPGWDAGSYGYHGDDGHFFSSSGSGTAYGEKFGTGDTVGCGVNLIENNIFFTKNGVLQGIAMRGLDFGQELYPVVGLQMPNEMIDANFGQVPFVFDIYEHMDKTRAIVSQKIRSVDIPPIMKHDICHKIVANFLQTEGYSETFAKFKKHISEPSEEPIEMIQTRRKIMDLIRTHKSGDALQIIRDVYPQMMTSEEKSRKQAILLLRIQYFVELAYQFVMKEEFPQPKAKNGNSYTNGNSVSSTSLSNNKKKRSYSRHLPDNDVPNRKSHSGRASVASRLSAEQPSSSKNGSANGNGVAFHDVGLERDETENGSTDLENPHNTDYLPEDQSRVGELVLLGREITEEAQNLDYVDDYLVTVIEEALPSLYLSKEGFKNHSMLRKKHCNNVAKRVNDSIIECFHTETDLRGPVGVNLPRVFETWKEKKHSLLVHECPSSIFMDDERIIYGISDEDFDDEDSPSEEEKSDAETASSYTDDTEENSEFGESQGSGTSGDEGEEVMDSDQPTHSRTAITVAH